MSAHVKLRVVTKCAQCPAYTLEAGGRTSNWCSILLKTNPMKARGSRPKPCPIDEGIALVYVSDEGKAIPGLPRQRERLSAPIPGMVFWAGKSPTKFLLSVDGKLYYWDREYSDSPKDWLPWHEDQGWLFDGTPLYAEPPGDMPSHLTFAPEKEAK